MILMSKFIRKDIHRFSTGSLTIALAGAALLFMGCSSTRMQTTRNSSVQLAAPFRNVLVVGMDERPDIRQRFENDVVRFLEARKVHGIATAGSFTLAEFRGDRAQIRQKFAAAKGDCVLFVHVTDRDSFSQGPPASLGSDDMGAVSESRYIVMTSVGGAIQSDVQIGARLFRLPDSTLIWSGLVDTKLGENYDPVVVLDSVAKTIVDGMAKDQVIP